MQKLTELGVSDFELLNMTRCVVKGNEKDGLKKQERLNRIAREAVKQCRRGTVPVVGTPMSLKQAAKKMSACDLLLVPWEEAEGLTLAKAYEAYPDAKNIGIVIGPEGGISPEEIEVMKGYGAKPVTLGPRILRAETAAIASAAMVMTLWGDCK
ncbi:MAG: RsmE family RNA methyltransferase [Clostridia bacterium]|nr:RsmE family RNA methyltransferase [Clostridia bacterium]